MRHRATALVVVTALACGGGAEPPGEAAPPSAGRASPSAQATLRITLERGPCYGRCPVYQVTLMGDRTIAYEGIRFVVHEGPVTDRIPVERVEELTRAFGDAGFSALEDRYVSGVPACGRHATDLPVVVTSLTRGSDTKRVEHDHGCLGAPRELAALEDRMDEVTRSWRWTTGRER